MAKSFQSASNLYIQLSKSLRSNLSNIKRRTDIVSPQLCDDALARLAPSLQKYKGCTIIDINPGIGLWSSKIHDLVKPCQHLLAEPPSSTFLRHLESLVKIPSSRYKLLDWPKLEPWEPDRYVAEGLLPALDAHDSTEPNQSILFLANTAYSAHQYAGSSTPRTHLKLLCWASDIANGVTFHAGGPVRMLLWCPEKDVASILPRTIRNRTKLSLLMETTCKIEEIVSSDELVSARQKKRDQVVELDSGKRVAKLMGESGVSIPPERETTLQKHIKEVVGRSKSKSAAGLAEATSTRTRGWHEELEDLGEKFKDVPTDSKGRYIMRRIPTEIVEDPQFTRFLELTRNFKHAQKQTALIEELLQQQAEVDALDLQAHAPDLKESERMTALAKAQQIKQQIEEKLEDTKGHATRDEFEFFKHDRKAYASNPPLLMWDHRRAEPLKAYKEEFYPEKPLSLLDVQPRHPLPYRLSGAQLLFFRMLTTALWQNRGDNLTALDRIAPGAFDAVTPNVPALTDPTRGGERNILDLTIHRLTPEMAYGLTKAWFDWPLRPNLGDLIHAGSLVDDIQADEGVRPRGR